MYNTEAMQHLVQTLKNQVGKCVSTTLRKIKELKNAKSISDDPSDDDYEGKDEQIKDQEETTKRETRLGKRKPGDDSAGKNPDQPAANLKVQKTADTGE